MEISSTANSRGRCLSLGFVKRLQVPFLDVLDGVPADARMLGDVFDGHMLGQAQGVAFEGMRVAATRIGEVDGDLANEAARVAFDARDREEAVGSVGRRSGKLRKSTRLAAMARELVRTAGGAAKTVAILFDREHDFTLEEVGAGITVAANAEAVIQVGSWTCWQLPLELSSYSQEWSACPHFQAFRTLLPDEPEKRRRSRGRTGPRTTVEGDLGRPTMGGRGRISLFHGTWRIDPQLAWQSG